MTLINKDGFLRIYSICYQGISQLFIVFSAKRQENPLLLLGQYSDDELDEGEGISKRLKTDADGSSSDDLDVEVIIG